MIYLLQLTDLSAMDLQPKSDLNEILLNDSYLNDLIEKGHLIIFNNDIVLSENYFIILGAIELALT